MFTGLMYHELPDGTRLVTIFEDGMMTDCYPHADFKDLPLGFYDFDLKPVRDPAELGL